MWSRVLASWQKLTRSKHLLVTNVKMDERIRHMKSYKHLMEKCVSAQNIKLAIRKAAKGKRDRKRVQMILADMDSYVPHFQEMAIGYKHRNKPPKVIYDGISRKKREIIVPSFDEQVLHHMIVNVLEPIIKKGIYEHVHGSIPKRGPYAGKKVIQKWLTHDRKNCRYVLKMDIRQFFGSIPHYTLMEYMGRYIHDEIFLKLIGEVLDTTKVGLPLGFHTSHWLANWYLQGLDHYIKEDLKAVHYMRYMDDMVIFGPNKRKLHKMRISIGEYLKNNLGLELKGNYQVFNMEYRDKHGKVRGRDLDFMGFRFRHNRITMRKAIMLRMCRKAKKLSRKEKITVHDCKQMMSALSWLKNTDTYNMYLKYIKPYVNFQYMKRRISRYDRRQNRRLNYAVV